MPSVLSGRPFWPQGLRLVPVGHGSTPRVLTQIATSAKRCLWGFAQIDIASPSSPLRCLLCFLRALLGPSSVSISPLRGPKNKNSHMKKNSQEKIWNRFKVFFGSKSHLIFSSLFLFFLFMSFCSPSFFSRFFINFFIIALLEPQTPEWNPLIPKLRSTNLFFDYKEAKMTLRRITWGAIFIFYFFHFRYG